MGEYYTSARMGNTILVREVEYYTSAREGEYYTCARGGNITHVLHIFVETAISPTHYYLMGNIVQVPAYLHFYWLRCVCEKYIMLCRSLFCHFFKVLKMMQSRYFQTPDQHYLTLMDYSTHNIDIYGNPGVLTLSIPVNVQPGELVRVRFLDEDWERNIQVLRIGANYNTKRVWILIQPTRLIEFRHYNNPIAVLFNYPNISNVAAG